MNIQVNGKNVSLEGPVTVTVLLAQQRVESPDMVAVQINGEFIEKERYAEMMVESGAEVEFLYFMGGGAGA